MSTIVLILALVLVCLIAAGLYLWFKARNPSALAHALPFIKPAHRKLTDEERAAVEFYLNQQNKLSNKLLPGGGATLPAAKLALTRKAITFIPSRTPSPATVWPATIPINGAITSMPKRYICRRFGNPTSPPTTMWK